MFKAGASKVKITPKSAVYIAGYGQNRVSVGVHDDLWARCLVLECEDRRIAIVSLDLIGLFLDDVDKVRKGCEVYGFKPEDVLVACTHNHEGPDTLGLWGPDLYHSGVDEGYMDCLRDIIIKCVGEAAGMVEGADVAFSSTNVEGVSRNARNPGVLDNELVVVKVDSKKGSPIATVVNFANHAEVLGSRNNLITADFPNYLYRYVEGRRGGIALFLNGALGGMVTPDVRSHSFEEAERVGVTIGERALEALKEAEVFKEPRIDVKKSVIKVPLQNERFKALRKVGVLSRRSLRDWELESEVYLINFGVAQMATMPGEAFPEVGFRVKGLMKARYRMVVGLVNDELGYIIPEEDFTPGKYEESMSVGPKIATVILEAFKKMAS